MGGKHVVNLARRQLQNTECVDLETFVKIMNALLLLLWLKIWIADKF